MSDLKTTGATDMSTTTYIHAELYKTLEKHLVFYKHMARLYSAQSVPEICEHLKKLLSELVNYRLVKVLAWDSMRNAYDTIMTTGSPREDGIFNCEQAMLDWGAESDGTCVVPVEDEVQLRLGARSMLIIPVRGSQKALGVIIVWCDMDPTGSNRLMMQSLDILGKAFGGVLENITLTQRYQRTANMMDDIIESVPHAIIAVNADDRVIACNRNAEFLFDFKRAFMLGEKLSDMLPPAISLPMTTLALSAISGNEEIDYELEYALPHDEQITMGISASQLHDKDGRVRGALFICRDMSLSREVQKLRELDLMKNEFVHTVSHELKTPLTAIMGGSELLAEERDKFSAQDAEILDIIIDNSHRLKELINDLLDLSRLETGRLSLDRLPCDLHSLAAEVACLFTNNKNGCEVILRQPEKLPVISGDPDKLKQVLQNILGNAVKYSPNGGIVQVWFESTDNRVSIHIKDQGIGIPKDQLPFIWDKFYRVDSTTTSSIEGTGLGLAITKHIVELHGGTVGAASELGEGSTFTVTLPAE